MKANLILRVFLGLIALAPVVVHAQSHEGFLYGKVYTKKSVYTGPIRWGTEEVLWTDFFNADKTDRPYEKMIPQEKTSSSWDSFDWSISSIWENSTTHQFTCQFGNIREMRMLSNGDVALQLKNGRVLRVEDGGNDVGGKVQVLDPELGVVNIDWDNIERIEFMSTPAKLPGTFGMPIYGTIEGARREKYTGFIVWDNDERLTTDKLDGDNEDGDVSIPFGDIVNIERQGRGVFVKLRSGREMRLSGSNDVNDGNRGILVVVPEIGVAKFSWRAFNKLTLQTPPNTGPSFTSFGDPQLLYGEVSRLNGDNVSGQIVFDIDEFLDFEVVEGEENDIEYLVPLKNIRKITPRNYDYSQVELTSGTSLLLGEGRDVSAKNAGLLVFPKGQKDPVFVSWRNINEITFDHH